MENEIESYGPRGTINYSDHSLIISHVPNLKTKEGGRLINPHNSREEERLINLCKRFFFFIVLFFHHKNIKEKKRKKKKLLLLEDFSI